MTRFWWVRHGPTHAKTMVGWSDIAADLSDVAAIDRLADFLPAEALIVSSDLIRASATADAIARSRHRLPHNSALREIHFGAWEMRSFAEIESEAPDHIRAYWETPGDVCPPGGESWNALCSRIQGAIAELLTRHTGRDIIVVAHFGAILAALQLAEGLSPEQVFSHRIDNLSVTKLVFEDHQWSAPLVNHRP